MGCPAPCAGVRSRQRSLRGAARRPRCSGSSPAFSGAPGPVVGLELKPCLKLFDRHEFLGHFPGQSQDHLVGVCRALATVASHCSCWAGRAAGPRPLCPAWLIKGCLGGRSGEGTVARLLPAWGEGHSRNRALGEPGMSVDAEPLAAGVAWASLEPSPDPSGRGALPAACCSPCFLGGSRWRGAAPSWDAHPLGLLRLHMVGLEG